MRVILGVLALGLCALAYDAVLFSNDQELGRDHPSFDALLSGASAEHPLVFLVEPDFTLGQFSRQASAYLSAGNPSALASVVRSAKHSSQRYLDYTAHIPNAVLITSADQFKAGEAVLLVAGDDWSSLEQISEQILSKLKRYTAVLTNTEAVTQHASRVKRLSSDLLTEEEDTAQEKPARQTSDNGAVAGPDMDLPLSLPAFNRSGTPPQTSGSCLLYLEGISVIVSKIQGDVPSAFVSAAATIVNGTFKAGDSNVDCAVNATGIQNYKFTISITPNSNVVGTNAGGAQFQVSQNQPIEFQLNFMSDLQHYWSLQSVTLLTDITVSQTDKGKGAVLTGPVTAKAGKAKGVGYMGVNAVVGYSFNCGDTPAAWFNATDGHAVGISLHNFQVRLNGVNATAGHYFDLQVGDCVGTFSTGSLMGIVTALILLSVFIFGFLMLNSVQTMDRFDDPKQKQIIINVRE